MFEPLAPNANLIASAILFFGARPARYEKIAALLLAGAASVCLGMRGPAETAALLFLSYCGLTGILVAAMRLYFDRARDSGLLWRALFPPAFGTLSTWLLELKSSGLTYDNYLYAFDGSLGFQPGFWAGRILLDTPWLQHASILAYQQLPAMGALAYVLRWHTSVADAWRFVRLVVAIGLVGYCGYLLFPAAGSPILFPRQFPRHAPKLESVGIAPVSVPAHVPRNCMPSLHTAWALAVWWEVRRRGRVLRSCFAAALGMLLLRTLSVHYVIDMIVAVPFTMALYALCRCVSPWASARRRLAFAGGILATGCWLLALRYAVTVFISLPSLSWIAAVATVAGSWVLWRSLDDTSAAMPAANAERFERPAAHTV